MGFWSRLFGGSSGTQAQVDYSTRTDDELRALHRTRMDLTEAAQRALDEELSRRGVSVMDTQTAEGAAPGMGSEFESMLVSREAELEGSPEAAEAWEMVREAFTLLTQKQDFQSAIERSERAIERARQAPKPVPFIVGAAYHLIAQSFLMRERWELAQPPLEQAIAQFEQDANDASAYEVLKYSGDLGRVLQLQGLTEEAERRLRDAVTYGRRVAPGEPILAHLLEELAALLKKRGLESDAAALEQEAQAIHDTLEEEAP